MPIATGDIIKLLCDLAEVEGIRVTVNESLKGGLLTGAATLIGGLALGPAGLFAGGVLGGFTSYVYSRGKFQSLATVVMNMDPSTQEKLANIIRVFLLRNGIVDVTQFVKIFCNPQLKITLILMVLQFIYRLWKLLMDPRTPIMAGAMAGSLAAYFNAYSYKKKV